MRRLGFVLLLAPFLVGAQNLSSDSTATVETTADASVHGGTLKATEAILKADGLHDAVLLRFRTALIEKWIIKKAVIAFHIPSGAAVPGTLLVTGVTGTWNEGSINPPIIGEGEMIATRKLQDDWVTVELPAKIARQMAASAKVSIALSVPDGELLTLHSRRTGQFMPYLLVRGQSFRPK